MANQPSVYSYEKILDAAIELIRQGGWQSVTTRAIAKKLGSSTMPIYSRVSSVDELLKDIQRMARKQLIEYQQKDYTGEVLLNLAVGYVMFARDEKHLFRFLYLEKPEKINTEGETAMKEIFFADFGEESPQGKALKDLKLSGQEMLMQNTWIFTHGLAMLANAEALSSDSDETIQQHLMKAGQAFYLLGLNEEGKLSISESIENDEENEVNKS